MHWKITGFEIWNLNLKFTFEIWISNFKLNHLPCSVRMLCLLEYLAIVYSKLLLFLADRLRAQCLAGTMNPAKYIEIKTYVTEAIHGYKKRRKCFTLDCVEIFCILLVSLTSVYALVLPYITSCFSALADDMSSGGLYDLTLIRFTECISQNIHIFLYSYFGLFCLQ